MENALVGTTPLSNTRALRITELPSLQHPVAGQFVGGVDGRLVVAGGCRWSTPQSLGGKKIFEDRIEALEARTAEWQLIGRLPRALAYGSAASLKHTILFAGGQDHGRASRSIWALSLHGSNYQMTPWPDLPAHMTNFSMAPAGDRVYIFGGQESNDKEASAQLWSLEIDPEGSPVSDWRPNDSLPGVGRILTAAACYRETLYILGGASLLRGTDRTLQRHYLREAWSFELNEGWKRLPDLPAASVAAPATCDDDGNVILIGGDDGSMAGVKVQEGQQHPGFSRTIVRYSPIDNTWRPVGQLPLGLVTTGCAVWKDGRIAVPGGEDLPGSRSGRVFEIQFDQY